MADVIVHEKPAMTAREARAAVEAARGHLESARGLVLELFERRGWKSLGYATPQECGAAEFGMSSDRFNRLLRTARLEREVLPDGAPLGQVAATTLEKLRELPPGQRKAAFEAAGPQPTPSRISEIIAKAKAGVDPALLAASVRQQERENIEAGGRAEERAAEDDREHRIKSALWHLKRARSLLLALGGESEDAIALIRAAADGVKELREVG